MSSAAQPRVHTRPFVHALNAIGREEFALRWEQAQRVVHENGLAYNSFAPAPNQLRPWQLDALPLLISATEWQSVTAAIRQRARLLNLILQDVYGPQNLLKRGALPADLVYAHPDFLRPYVGYTPPNNRFLNVYAADLARSPDGQWWAIGDRTESPSGLGYVLENRIAISGMLPEVFHQCHVQRLAPFFIALQEMLRGLAPHNRENPRMVLLTHGPTSPNYFEDAYLARYLGMTLVEGGDLTVRHEQVLLKTLGGLLPVDVIYRRPNSSDCDPLELNSTSRLGVAGLTQSLRSGQVSLANPLGSGLVESPAFMAYLPQLCQTLLNEPLLMPNVATWWCGDPVALAHVKANIDRLLFLPAFRRRGAARPAQSLFVGMTKEQIWERVSAQPAAYAAQERVARSCVPMWGHLLQPAHLAVRAYAVSTPDSYEVMHGALARTSDSAGFLDESIRQGEGSKDTWVLAAGPVEHVSLLEEPGQAIVLRRSGAELPSRAADNFFWLGRQLERAEATARLLRSTVNRMTGETRFTSNVELPVLLRCLAELGQIEPGYAVSDLQTRLPAIEASLPFAVCDAESHNSLRGVLDESMLLGSLVRDRLSQDTWRILRRMDDSFRPVQAEAMSLADVRDLTDVLIARLAAFSGIVRESMTRTQAYYFLELGRRLERSLQILNVIKGIFIPLPAAHRPIFETALEVSDSLMTYRSRYMSNFQLAAVLDLLITDETSPRSLAYQFVELQSHVEQLPRDRSLPGFTEEQRQAMSLLNSIRMLDIAALADSHSLGDYSQLRKLTEAWESALPQLAEAISHRYLVHTVAAHQLSEIRP
ncbi:MAG: circularly permuted type 2 ATP-grasp protein [Planctomycetales bacterium]|nr:circularly permuted type 2 ATP-grasp protein [Planctomycetales bacterium]